MQKHIELISEGLTLRGYLHLPDGVSNPPIVCMFHGFTGNKVEDHFFYVRLSRQLEKMGIASIRMDFGNSGESDGVFEDMTPRGEINDAINIIDFVKELECINKNKIGLIGFSMGGMVASIAASERNNDIKSLVLIAPSSRLEDKFATFFSDNDEYVDINGLKFSRKAYENMKTIDTINEARNYKGEVLIVHGTDDQAVPMESSKSYEDIYGDKVVYKYIQGASHVFNKISWEEEMRSSIAQFLTKTLMGD